MQLFSAFSVQNFFTLHHTAQTFNNFEEKGFVQIFLWNKENDGSKKFLLHSQSFLPYHR